MGKLLKLQKNLHCLLYTEKSLKKITHGILCRLWACGPSTREIPEEHIKKVLANKMLEAVEENLEIEANDDMLRNFKIYRAKLRVVKKMR